MMQILWTPHMLPRTMTRAEWREIDRWRRVTQRELNKQGDAAMRDLLIFGSARIDVDRIINPPMIVHAKMMGWQP